MRETNTLLKTNPLHTDTAREPTQLKCTQEKTAVQNPRVNNYPLNEKTLTGTGADSCTDRVFKLGQEGSKKMSPLWLLFLNAMFGLHHV